MCKRKKGVESRVPILHFTITPQKAYSPRQLPHHPFGKQMAVVGNIEEHVGFQMQHIDSHPFLRWMIWWLSKVVQPYVVRDIHCRDPDPWNPMVPNQVKLFHPNLLYRVMYLGQCGVFIKSAFFLRKKQLPNHLSQSLNGIQSCRQKGQYFGKNCLRCRQSSLSILYIYLLDDWHHQSSDQLVNSVSKFSYRYLINIPNSKGRTN